MRSPLIVMALPAEGQGRFDRLPVLYTGVGKVNAAYRLAKALHERSPGHVVNLGTAGSAAFSAGAVVNCTGFVQRDMDASALGVPRFCTPFEERTSSVLAYGERVAHLPEGVCGTGDSFHTGGASEDFTVADMEAFALADVCRQESVPFTCIKFITDGADGRAADDWGAALVRAAAALYDAYEALSDGMPLRT
jgi:adenosylhomocysteine nucleosidase